MNRFNNQQKTKTMIQPNELRLGNCVQTPLGDIMIVTQLGHQDNKDFIGASQYKNGELVGFGMNGFKPIELTPEILEKCGFETPFIMKDSVKYLDGVMIDLHNGKILLRDNHMIEIKYLHQLQNLYYALTGKELDISKFIEQQKNILEN